MRTLKPHQEKALSALKNGSILWGGVGSGKSFVAVSYYVKQESPKAVYVITTAKKRDSLDWQREFANAAVGMTATATAHGVLTIDSWNNIGKYKRVTNAFFIFDEQRLVGSGGWVKAFIQISKKNSWIMLSATPGDTWLDYIPIFVANGFYPNRAAFKAEHVVYKPYMKFPVVSHYTNVGKLGKLRNSILVHMPYESHTTRHLVKVPVSHSQDQMKMIIKSRWDPFKEQPLRGSAEFYALLRKVANMDKSRLVRVKEILTKHPKVIVFYNFNYELEALRTLNELDGVQIAEWNGHKHEEIPDSESWVYLVQYTAGAEGWECIRTDAMIFYSQTPSYKQWEQAFGRIDRLNTPFKDLWYYLLISDSIIDRAIRRSIKAKRDFNILDLSDFCGI